ncbi:MAG: FAD-dependent monooxygenase [Nitrospirales bacterium]
MDLKTDVVIIGAGGGGAVLGLSLSRKGIAHIILEQASGPPRGLRGEILQPNGQRLLQELQLLELLPKESFKPVRYFHFRKCGGTRLCSIDYGMLPEPFNQALVVWPNVVHQTILERHQRECSQRLYFGATFERVIRRDGRVIGVEGRMDNEPFRIEAKVVVGADGPFSQVREAFGIPYSLHRYEDSYLIAMLDSPGSFDEAQYYVGRKTILGLFPAAGNKAYAFYMVASNALDALKARGVETLQREWNAIAPGNEAMFNTLQDWTQTAYMGTGRVKAKTWVVDGGVLIGDAAHGMNPHASQGRMQAMVDATILAPILAKCFEKDNWSASALKPFEQARRKQVGMLQQLADEEVFFWNTGNPMLGWLRDRVFRTMDRNPRLKYQILTATAGLRETAPFGWMDRLQAAGFLPDSRAQQVPVHDKAFPNPI